jgi:hypothetical protein
MNFLYNLLARVLILAFLVAPNVTPSVAFVAPGPVNLGPASAAGPSFQTLWIYKANNTTHLNLVADANGILHAGFTAYSADGSGWPAYYATCSTHCDK